MKYIKPELTVLGRAISAVRGGTKVSNAVQDGNDITKFHTVPAYEADE